MPECLVHLHNDPKEGRMEMTEREQRVTVLLEILNRVEKSKNGNSARRLAKEWNMEHYEVRNSLLFQHSDYFRFRFTQNLRTSKGTYDEILVTLERSVFCVNGTLLALSFRIFDESIDLNLHLDENLTEEEKANAHAITTHFLRHDMELPD